MNSPDMMKDTLKSYRRYIVHFHLHLDEMVIQNTGCLATESVSMLLSEIVYKSIDIK